MYVQEATGSFRKVNEALFEKDKTAEDCGCEFFDADGDGDADLFVAGGGYEFENKDPLLQGRLYLNDGKGHFTAAGGAIPDWPASASCVKAADIDGDGIPDFIVGKRYWSHLDSYFDPDAYGAPLLYVYLTVRDKKAPGGARFVPELVHNRSGAGSDVTTADLNKDGAVDIITSTDRGTFIFWNMGSKKKSSGK